MQGDSLLEELSERVELGGDCRGVADLLHQGHERPEVSSVHWGEEVPDGSRDVWHRCHCVLAYRSWGRAWPSDRVGGLGVSA